MHIAIFNSSFSRYCYCYCNSSDGYCQCLGAKQVIVSDGSDSRIGPGSARDRPFLKGSGSNFGEGPKRGIGSGSRSRIEGPEGPENLL